MPFANYKDWEDCIAKNKDKENPEAYCGSIKAKVEEAEDQHDLTTPDGGDIPENNSLATPAGEVTEEEKELKRGEQTPINQKDLVQENDGLLEYEGKVYAEVKGNESHRDKCENCGDERGTIDPTKCSNCGEDMPFKHDKKEDFGFEVEANEESSVSGPPADSTMLVIDDELPKGENLPLDDDPLFKEELAEGIPLNENYIQDQFDQYYRPVYVGESLDVNGDNILIFENKYYTTEGLGNCIFCQGAGKVTVENLGLKDCPDCDGTGDVQTQPMANPMLGTNPNEGMQNPMEQQQIPNPMEQQQPNPMEQQPQQIPNDPSQPTAPDQIPQQPSVDPQEVAMKKPEDKKPQFGEAFIPKIDDKIDNLINERLKLKLGESFTGKCKYCSDNDFDSNEELLNHEYEHEHSNSTESKSNELKLGEVNPNHADDGKFSSGSDIGKGGFGPDEQGRTEDDPMYATGGNSTPESLRREYEDDIKSYEDEIKGGAPKDFVQQKIDNWKQKIKDLNAKYPPKAKESKNHACPTNVKEYKTFIDTKLEVLKKRAKAGEAVSMMYGLPTISKEGRKIKGILAYAGVSLNDRIYLPEELKKGHLKTLPLLLNHSSIAGAENELDRLDDEMREHLYNEKDYKIGEVKLEWNPEKLTLYYEGIVTNKFFQKEIDDMDMAVSLGIFYDSDSPKVCDENCYTLIKGAEFREVSLVYHAGFPIATIEAVEAELKQKSLEDIHHGGANVLDDSTTVNSEINKKESTEDHLESEKDEAEEELDELVPTGQPIDVEEKPKGEPPIIMAESFYTPQNFSVKGVTGMTISNSNGVQKYTLDPNMSYETNMIHFNVGQRGAHIFGEQLQPKMLVPNELREEIENMDTVKLPNKDILKQ